MKFTEESSRINLEMGNFELYELGPEPSSAIHAWSTCQKDWPCVLAAFVFFLRRRVKVVAWASQSARWVSTTKESRGPCHSDIRNEKTRRQAPHRFYICSTILKHELTLSHASATICSASRTSSGGATTLKFRGWSRRRQILERLPSPWNMAVNLTAQHWRPKKTSGCQHHTFHFVSTFSSCCHAVTIHHNFYLQLFCTRFAPRKYVIWGVRRKSSSDLPVFKWFGLAYRDRQQKGL